MRLDGKAIVITGAGAGLGRECALLFAEEGAHVVVTDIDGGRAEDVARLVTERGGTAIALKTDVSVENDVRAAVDTAVEAFGRLDLMHSNAGMPVRGFGTIPFEELTEADYRQAIDVNFLGGIFAAKHAARVMKEQGGGTILFTSSAGALVGFAGFSVYGAAKGGINALVRGLAVDLGPYGIRVNAICPMHGMSVNFALEPDAPVVGLSYDEALGAWDPAQAPYPLRLPRPPRLRDNAYAALFLASDDSEYISGVCLPTTDAGTLSLVAMDLNRRPEGVPQ